MSRRTIQFSIKAVLVLTLLVAMAFWMFREFSAPLWYLAVAYMLVGFGQAARSHRVWRFYRHERQTGRRDACELLLSGLLLSIPMYLVVLAVLVCRTADYYPSDVLLVFVLLGMMSQVPAFLTNLSAILVYCNELLDGRLRAVWLLNMANSILAFSMLLPLGDAARQPTPRLPEAPVPKLRPQQFSLKAILFVTLAVAVLLWLVRGREVWIQVLLVCYGLVGIGQIVLNYSIRGSLRAGGEGKTDRRESFELMQSAWLFSMPMALVVLVWLVASKIDTWYGCNWESSGALRLSWLIAVVMLVPAFLTNLSAVIVVVRPLRDWPLALLWLLNLGSAILMFFVWFGPAIRDFAK